MKRNLTPKTLFLLGGLALVSCGGKPSSVASSTSLGSDEAFSALASGLNAFFSHDKLGFNYSRHPDTVKSGKKSNDFSLTYTPVERPATSSSSALTAETSASSSLPIDFSKPIVIGLSGFAADGFPANCYVNGLSDSVGDSLLAYAYLDYPTISASQGDSTLLNSTENYVTNYLDLNSFYFDLNGLSSLEISAINSAVQSIPGNDGWMFPSGNRGKAALNENVSSFLSFFLPIQHYLPSLTDAIISSLKKDQEGSRSLDQKFSQSEEGITLSLAVPSFARAYTLLVDWTKAMIIAKTSDEFEQAAKFALINNAILKPIKKYGDCLSSFILSASLTYSVSGLKEASFVFDGAADFMKLKAAYSSDNPSGFVTAFHGAGILGFVVDDAAAVPTPTPALSTYPDIPPVKLI
ncbi:MAG: hypothetical protein WCS90_04625 [Bacilli bacterium]